jgi:hypothetical protein
MKGRFWGQASVGQPGVGSSTGDFERWLQGALKVGHLSLWELCEGNLERGGGPLLGTLEDRQKRLWRWASLSIVALLGKL